MAFLDNLGKKISHAGQVAVQKTKELTDIARLKSMISDEEKKIENNYCQIGKMYVAMHYDDFTTDFAELINEVRQSEEKLSEYRQQIHTLKGVLLCEKCGSEISSSASFCQSCGFPVAKESQADASVDMNKCSACGHLVEKCMRFCTACGNPMTDGDSANVHKCAGCGAELSEGLDFCVKCGTKVGQD